MHHINFLSRLPTPFTYTVCFADKARILFVALANNCCTGIVPGLFQCFFRRKLAGCPLVFSSIGFPDKTFVKPSLLGSLKAARIITHYSAPGFTLREMFLSVFQIGLTNFGDCAVWRFLEFWIRRVFWWPKLSRTANWKEVTEWTTGQQYIPQSNLPRNTRLHFYSFSDFRRLNNVFKLR